MYLLHVPFMPCLPRRVAAMLATLALLTVPVRGVQACEMGGAVADASEMAGHDHAAMTTAAMSAGELSPDAGDRDDAGDRPHPSCDHLVGCAPLAVANHSTIVASDIATPVRPVPFVADRVESPTRALEPPPPKG
jgi:hypothetical protein